MYCIDFYVIIYLIKTNWRKNMKIHYFQRYKEKENVATANTMLLLSRLYNYSPAKFYKFIQYKILDENINLELYFQMQHKSEYSTPDAVITQHGFKILVETKIGDNFEIKQLENHINGFEKNDNLKILLTLNKDNELKKNIKNELDTLCKANNVKTKHFSFSSIITDIKDILNDNDYEMFEILEDYSQYCTYDKLTNDGWKKMKVRTTGATFNINKELNLYYDNADNGYSAHDYLGLYKDKSIRVIGKITKVVTAVYENNKVKIIHDDSNISEEMKNKIEKAIIDADKYGYNLKTKEHNYFFVDNFYETDFKKLGKPLQGSKIFDLTTLVKKNGKEITSKKNMPSTQDIANQLKNQTWGKEQE